MSEAVVALAVMGALAALVASREVVPALIVLGVAGIAGVVDWGVRRSRRKLLQDGVAAVGAVEQVGVDGRSSTLLVRYETPAGVVRSRTQVERRLIASTRDYPQVGDAAFVVYDPKAVTRNEVWALARGPEHDSVAARRYVHRSRTRASVMAGAFFLVTCGAPTLWQYWKAVSPARIASCEKSYSHHWWFHLVLNDARRATITSNDVVDLASCPPPGSAFEKRRGEFGYRLGGQLRPMNQGGVIFPGLLGLAGAALLAYGIVQGRKARERELRGLR